MNTQQHESATDGQTRIYRARQIEQILPRIKAELGADAIVVAQREGLAGGVAGFFQQPFVEVHARPASASAGLLDVYDDHMEDEAVDAFEPFMPTVQAPAPAPQAPPVHTPPAYEPAPPPAAPVNVAQAYVPSPETDMPMPAPQAEVPAPHVFEPAEEPEFTGPLAQALTPAELDRFAAHLQAAAHPAAAAQPEPQVAAPVLQAYEPQVVAPAPQAFVAQPEPQVMAPAPQAYVAQPEPQVMAPAPQAYVAQPEPQVMAPAPQAYEPQVYAQAVPAQPQYAAQPAMQPQPFIQPMPEHTFAPEPTYGQPVPVDPRIEAMISALVASGVQQDLAADVVSETISHALPFGTPRQMKRLVREALARRIDTAPSFRGRRRAMAVVGAPGAGKTQVASRLAAAYHQGGDLPVRLVALEDGADLASKRVWPKASEGIAVVDTPAVSPIDGAGIAELAGQLAALDLDEVHVALPATLSKPAAEQMLDALAPLGITHLVLTHADQTSHVGPAMSLAAERGIPFSFVNGPDLQPADANDLAKRVIG